MVSATPWTFTHLDTTWTLEVEGDKLHVTADCPEPWICKKSWKEGAGTQKSRTCNWWKIGNFFGRIARDLF